MEFSHNIIFYKHNIQDLLVRIAHNTTPGNHLSDQFLGAFLGAVCAFLFFLLGEYIKRKIDWKKEVRKEHSYLERYFGDISQILQYNKGLLPKIINDYNNKSANIMNFTLLPIRDGATMRMNDIIFINRMEIYFTELKRLNLSLENINKWKSSINDDLLSELEERRKRGKLILDNFLIQAEDYQKVFEYHLDKIEDLVAENNVLLKKYKNWEYNERKVVKEVALRKELIQKEKDAVKSQKNNPIFNDHLDKLKKFGLYKDES